MEQKDFSKYSDSELDDIYRHINREKYPDRFRSLVEEIEKRKAAQPAVELKDKRPMGKPEKFFKFLFTSSFSLLVIIIVFELLREFAFGYHLVFVLFMLLLLGWGYSRFAKRKKTNN
ncbi:MAG: hypothetical protein L0Y80_07735 [Ignavibacteriae bacterium]|nr:hypothetical protein [Ignavibacteriota bacterium]